MMGGTDSWWTVSCVWMVPRRGGRPWTTREPCATRVRCQVAACSNSHVLPLPRWHNRASSGAVFRRSSKRCPSVTPCRSGQSLWAVAPWGSSRGRLGRRLFAGSGGVGLCAALSSKVLGRGSRLLTTNETVVRGHRNDDPPGRGYPDRDETLPPIKYPGSYHEPLTHPPTRMPIAADSTNLPAVFSL